jgi:hypothetical protein
MPEIVKRAECTARKNVGQDHQIMAKDGVMCCLRTKLLRGRGSVCRSVKKSVFRMVRTGRSKTSQFLRLDYNLVYSVILSGHKNCLHIYNSYITHPRLKIRPVLESVGKYIGGFSRNFVLHSSNRAKPGN